jgi:hypothetical protein
MIRTRAAAPVALALAASWVAACSGSNSAHRAGSSTTPAEYAPAQAEAAPAHPGAGEAHEEPLAGAPAERPGLGTEFGEQVHSRVFVEPFQRASSEPFAVLAMHYNDAQGVQAQAHSRGGGLDPVSLSTPHGGISITLTDEDGDPLPGFAAPGRAYVVGQVGQRYNIQIVNHTEGRYEVVASVDGLDVIDGRAAGYAKRGYIVPPGGTLTIDGFRTSDDSVAAFRFSAVRDSYAARTGDDRNVGVIGFAFFAELGSEWTSDDSDDIELRETADPFPGRYAEPPP